MSDNRFWRDASERLTFGMDRVPSIEYPAICKAVAVAFGLEPDHASFCAGLDVVFMDFQRGDRLIGMEWDNWTGFTVVARTIDSEGLVREIAEWLLRSAWGRPGEIEEPRTK